MRFENLHTTFRIYFKRDRFELVIWKHFPWEFYLLDWDKIEGLK